MEIGIGQDLLRGFSVALTPQNLFFCFMGVTLGTLIGVLPGIGPAGTIAILVPFTFGMPVTTSIIMLAGVYYGAMYGGSTTAVLVNIPGETASIATTFDGYQMARKGRAGPALAMAAIASFVAGTFSVIVLTFVAGPVAMAALDFGPPEYFSLALLGCISAAYLAGKSLLKGIAMVLLGLMISTIGVDIITGGARFTFGSSTLLGGIEVIAVLMGLFGVTEILFMVERLVKVEVLQTKFRMRDLWPTGQDFKDSAAPIARGSLLGFVVGVLPGAGAMISSFLSYVVEKKLSRHPEKFGTGIIEGVAGPEAANNSATGGAMIPLMILGVPYSVITAIMLSALITHGLQPSPQLMNREPDFFWGVIASMYIGNAVCLILNLPLVGLWARLLLVPFSKLAPLILLFCVIGVYSVNSLSFDLWIMILIGGLGYLMRRAEYPAAPLVLSMVLGHIMENGLRQSLLISKGSPLLFVSRPISGILIAVSLLILVVPLVRWVFRKPTAIMPAMDED